MNFFTPQEEQLQIYNYKGVELIKYPPIDRLLPHDNWLFFNQGFDDAAREHCHGFYEMGTYCNGWEL